MFWDVLYVFLGNIFVHFWIACYNLLGQHVWVILDILPVFGQHFCVFFGYFTYPFLGATRLCVLEYFVCGNAILGNMFMCFLYFPFGNVFGPACYVFWDILPVAVIFCQRFCVF